MLNTEPNLLEARQYWDAEAATFDHETDHGLRDPVVREAWTNLLAQSLPHPPASILDIGCGTGSLSIVLASLGFDVTGADFSEAMIAQAQAKATATEQPVSFQVMDAFEPDFLPSQFDLIVCRHVLWMSPDPARTLRLWAALLEPKGRLVLIEGFWHTGAGLHAHQIVDALPSSFTSVQITDLSGRAEFWGGEVSDERYILVAKAQ